MDETRHEVKLDPRIEEVIERKVAAQFAQLEARVAQALAQLPQPTSGQSPNRASLFVFSGDLDRLQAAFVIANGAAAMGQGVTMFFTLRRFLHNGPGWSSGRLVGVQMNTRPGEVATQTDLAAVDQRDLDGAPAPRNRWGLTEAAAFAKQVRGRPPRGGKSGRRDETYVKIKGNWAYRSRAVDKEGHPIDF